MEANIDFSKFFEHSFDGVMIFNNSGELVYKNQVAGSITENAINNFNDFVTQFNSKYNLENLIGECKKVSYVSFSSGGMQINISLLDDDKFILMNIHNIANIFDMNLSDEAADGFLLLSPSLNILYANESSCDISGYSKEELLNMQYNNLFLAQDIALNPPKTIDIVNTKTVAVERKLITKNKKIINVEIHSKLLENGHYFSIIRNIDLRIEIRNQLAQKNEELVKVNNSLVQSELNYQYLFNNFPAALLVAKKDGSVENLNEMMRSGLGYESKDELLAMNLKEIQDIELYNDVNESISKNIKIEKFYNYTSKYGKTLFAKIHITPINYADEDKIILFAEDYTETAEQNKLMRILNIGVANSSAAIIVFDLKGKIVFVNDHAVKLTGYTDKELIGKTQEEFAGIYGNKTIYNEILNTVQNNKIWKGELKNTTKKGEEYWVRTTVSPMEDQFGNITNIISIQEDITQKKVIETELKLRTQQLTLLIDNLPYIINFKGGNNEWIKANDITLEILGIENKKIYIGKTNLELLPYCNKNKGLLEQGAILAEKAWGQKKTVCEELVLPHNNDGNIIFEITIIPLFHTDDKRKGLVIIGKDITKQKLYEEKLMLAKERAEQADRLKSAFLANMSHEIRTPLNAIQGFADVLASYELDKETLLKFTNIIKVNSKQLVSIIEDILFYSKLQVNKVNLQPVRFNLSNFFTQLKTTFDKEINITTDNQIDLSLYNDADKSSIIVEADQDKISEIFSKLIRNAIKFTSKGTIEFGYNLIDNKAIVFFVKDTGVGISKEKQEIIFEQFRQADDSTTRKFGGTGLGLSIVKSLVDLMDGEINLKSEPNIGSTFSFKIPLEILGIEDKVTVNNNSEVDWSNKTILVIDDVEEAILLMQQNLSPTKANLLTANDGLKAINIVKENDNIDVVLMDIQLLGMNGLDASKIIKTLRPNLPIIVHTAFRQSGYDSKSKAVGCDDIIYKPIDFKLLISKLNKFLQ